MTSESEQTRDHITSEIARMEKTQQAERRYDEIVKSLFYPEIFSRQEHVEQRFDGIEDSFDWIFDESRPEEQRTSSNHVVSENSTPIRTGFGSWLRYQHGAYWINGKAGSGKSTLMSHICNSHRTREMLADWCPARRLLTPTFFFWNTGSLLQKSVDGLLRSLLYQIIFECPELAQYFSVGGSIS